MRSILKILPVLFVIASPRVANGQIGSTKPGKKSSAGRKEKEYVTRIKKYPGIMAAVPLGSFADTHLLGIGADYSITLNRENDSFNWAFDAGAAFFTGKKVTVSQYSYKYPVYTSVHIMGGLHMLGTNFDPRILAGPSVGLYNGNARFTISGRLELNYLAGERFAVAPVLNMMIDPGSNTLWSAGIRVSLEL